MMLPSWTVSPSICIANCSSQCHWASQSQKNILSSPHLSLISVENLPELATEFSSVQFSSVPQPCPTLCNPMNCRTPGLPVHHQFPKITQIHVPWVSDAIQPSHPLSSPSPPAFNLSQHQGLFKWISSSYQVAKILEFQLLHQSFQWIFRTDFLEDGLVGSPCSKGLSRVFSNTTVQKH